MRTTVCWRPPWLKPTWPIGKIGPDRDSRMHQNFLRPEVQLEIRNCSPIPAENELNLADATVFERTMLILSTNPLKGSTLKM